MATTWYSCNPKSYLYILDQPNERSLHSKPVPRAGGVAIILSMAIGLLILCIAYECAINLPVIGLTMLIISIISFVDDRHSLSVKIRLFSQLTCAVIVVVSGDVLQPIVLPGFTLEWPTWIGTIILIVYLVWMINLYNFMDGMDGFAGGMTIIGFITFAILGYLAGHLIFSMSSVVIVAATTGFLFFNFPPARIFMGDTGSATLGLVSGAFSLWGSNEGIFPFWIALLVFSPFIIDATVTLIKRLLRSERIWQAHKTHYYQRLVEMGWDHRRTVLFEYVVMIVCSISAIIAINVSLYWQWLIVILLTSMYLVLAYSVDKKYRIFITRNQSI